MAVVSEPAPPPVFTPAAITRLRKKSRATRSAFADGLNVSLGTVRRWEAGTMRPSGLARRLLGVVQKHGFELVADA